MNGGMPSDSEDEMDIDYSESDGEGFQEPEKEGDFFSEEDLSEVKLSGASGEESAEEEQFSDEDYYGHESGDNSEPVSEAEDLLPETEGAKKKKKNAPKAKKSAFAAYEDFAHLLEEGLDEREDKVKERTHFANRMAGSKRGRGGRGGRGGSKRGRH